MQGPTSIEETECLEKKLKEAITVTQAYFKEISQLHVELRNTKKRNGLLECEALIKTHQSDRDAWYKTKDSLQATIQNLKLDNRQLDSDIRQRDEALQKAQNDRV